jgi:hypothetical protein
LSVPVDTVITALTITGRLRGGVEVNLMPAQIAEWHAFSSQPDGLPRCEGTLREELAGGGR